jgi:hypothetical protein
MLIAFIAIHVSWTFIWLHFVQKEISLSLADFLNDIAPYLLLSGLAIAAGYFITENIASTSVRLCCKIGIVSTLYLLVLWKADAVILKEAVRFIFKKKGVNRP